MRCPVKQILGGERLNDAARVHDHHPLSDPRNHPEVVGDEKHGHVVLFCEGLQQLENLGLHRDVERRRRLIGDENARFR